MMGSSIGRRLYLSFALLLAALAGLGGAQSCSATGLVHQVDASLDRSLATATALSELRVVEREAHALLVLAGRSASRGELPELAALEARFMGQLTALEALGYPADTLTELQGRFAEVTRLGQAQVEAAAAQRREEAGALGTRFGAQADELELRLERLANAEAARARAELGTLRTRLGQGAWTFAAGVVICLLGALGLALGLRRALVRPLEELTRVARDISRNGDLTQTIPVRSQDEVGQLAAAFKEMVERLRAIHVELQSSGNTLAESVMNVRSVSDAQARTVSTQSAALHETRVTAEQLRQTSALASHKAQAVLEVAERADALGREGEASVAQSVAGMSDLQHQVEEISRRIMDLGERTEQISAITETVKDLADQSNLLAVNAGIEAARSGEHGRGFAVVAQEIRALADQSIKATTRVRQILESVGRAVADVVDIAARGAVRMQMGLDQVRATGTSLRELSTIMRDNALSVRQIASAVGQQDAGINQILGAMNDLSRMMEETERQLAATRDAAAGLDAVSGRLNDVVQRYHV